jgi:hypothetical protein
MPDSVTFALPTVPAAEMSKDDQGALVVNQATAVIIAAYLSHATAMAQAGFGTVFQIQPLEIPSLISGVQDALKNF